MTESIEAVLEMLRMLPPETPVGEAIELMTDAMTSREAGRARSTCRHCKRPVEVRGDRWVHCNAERNVGCRAASYDESKPYDGRAWDESLDRSWKATPTKEDQR